MLFLVLVSWIGIEEISKPFQKKIDKAITVLWQADVVISNLKLEEKNQQHLSRFGAQGVFKLHQSDQLVGYLIMAKARSKFEDFEYAIYFDQNKNIKGVRILQYREDYGGEIASKRWLKQFENKTSNSPLTIGEDIQGISGATISYLAITKGVKNLTIIFSEIK